MDEQQQQLRELLERIQLNPRNPRSIKTSMEKKLKDSIREFPRMLELRPVVYDETPMALGGNMRLLKLRELVKEENFLLKPEYFKAATDLSSDEKEQFIIKDNVPFGDWDWDLLKADWDVKKLEKWGMNVSKLMDDRFYNRNVESPLYKPKDVKPAIDVLSNKEKAEKLLGEINAADIPEEEKEFLRMAATRHYVFDYGKIADYYAQSSPEIQRLYENSALVIIDFERAIENGYVELTKNIMDTQGEDHPDNG